MSGAVTTRWLALACIAAVVAPSATAWAGDRTDAPAVQPPNDAAPTATPRSAAPESDPDASAADGEPSPTAAPGSTPVVTPTPAPIAPPPLMPRKPDANDWPVEYVLRPLTVPARHELLVVSAALMLPDNGSLPPYSGAFHRYFRLGFALTAGLTPRIEISANVPRILCINANNPSGCSPFDYLDGSGLALGIGVVRTHAIQVKLSAGVSVALTDPPVGAASADVRAKWLIANVVAIEADLGISKWLSSPIVYEQHAVPNEGNAVPYGAGALQLYVQVSRHLLIDAALSSSAPLDDLGARILEPTAGVSWTFDDRSELGLSASDGSILARRGEANIIYNEFVEGWYQIYF